MSLFWMSTNDKPEKDGTYLVAVETDDGPEVLTLIWNGQRQQWIYEGQATYQHGFYIRPYSWAHRPDAPTRELFPSDED